MKSPGLETGAFLGLPGMVPLESITIHCNFGTSALGRKQTCPHSANSGHLSFPKVHTT
jgi:hypothetical protein